MAQPTKDLTIVQKFKDVINVDSVQEQFRNALQEGAPLFVASLIDIFSSDKNLQKCEPKAVIMEALKAATLKLPINKNLGFAYIIPYGDVPYFQLGYKGYIQLAMRTGQYRYINADVVYEGELVYHDKLTGEVSSQCHSLSHRTLCLGRPGVTAGPFPCSTKTKLSNKHGQHRWVYCRNGPHHL